MKTVFIVNPQAGPGKDIQKLIDSIQLASSKAGKDVQIYLTKAVDDARKFVKSYCEKFGKARFIACGGDGTLNEVLNGSIECLGAEIGVIPLGTGNDFCRNFRSQCCFKNIELQICNQIIAKTHPDLRVRFIV